MAAISHGLRRLWRDPLWFHAWVALVVAGVLAWAAWEVLRRPTGWPGLVLAWLAGVNLAAFAYYWLDKGFARGNYRRIPERVLHGLALAGGSPGAYAGMRTFRHKTIKGSFQVVFWAVIVVQVLLLTWVTWHHFRS